MTTKIKLKRNAKDEDPGYTFTDPKGRVWKLNGLFMGDTPAGWDLVIPEGFGGRGGDVCGFPTLKEARAKLAGLLDSEARTDKAEAEAAFRKARLDEIVPTLQGWIAEGAKAQADLIGRLTSVGSLCNRMAWGDGLAEDYRAYLAAEILHALNGERPLKTVVDWYFKQYTRDLVQNRFRHQSTSAMDVAVNEVKQQVVCEMVQRLQIWVKVVAEAEG